MIITIKSFLNYRKYEWDDEGEFFVAQGDMSNLSPEYVLVKEFDVTTDVPDDFDPTPQMIANLKGKKQEILAKAQMQAQNIDEQIQRMLCIDHKPTEGEEE